MSNAEVEAARIKKKKERERKGLRNTPLKTSNDVLADMGRLLGLNGA